MEIGAIIGGPETQESPLVMLGLFKGTEPPLSGTLADLDSALRGEITAVLNEGDFDGGRNKTLLLRTYGLIPAKRILLVGLGKRESFSSDVLREAAATAAVEARQLGVSEWHALIPGELGDEAIARSTGITLRQAAEAMVEGTRLGLYRFTELKTEEENQKPNPDRFSVLLPRPGDLAEVEAGLHEGQILAEATALARDLVNRPANIATPDHIAEIAEQIAKEAGLECRILDKPALEALGAGLLLSVNRGSDKPAQMIVLEHNAGQDDLPTVVLVGKGITFDSGGISLKQSSGMERMKGDMGGAAAILAATQAVAHLDLPLHVVALAPVTENMPDSRATKPGDVVRSLKGLTVEIINTDAEGRLILADALAYAEEFAPDAILDIATLTGGRVIALGNHAAAVMGDGDLIKRLRRAGDATGERVWPLPLFDEYGEQLESEVADLQNVGGRAASSIIGGFFLSKFVPDGVPWVHIDIAGLEIAQQAKPYVPKGGTGFGVRLLVQALRDWTS